MLSKDQETGASRHRYGEEVEIILPGSQDPGKNQISCLISLEEAQSIQEDGILDGGALII